MRGCVCLLVTLIALPVPAAGQPPQGVAAQDKPVKPAEAPKPAEMKLIEVVPDLPDYPNSVMASSEEKGPHEGWTHTWKRETRTTATFADVRKFYLELFVKKGWKVTVTKEKPGNSKWELTKGNAWGRVELDAGSTGIVKITAEWKTR